MSTNSRQQQQPRRELHKQPPTQTGNTSNNNNKASKEYFSRSRIEFRYFVSMRLLHTQKPTHTHTQTADSVVKGVREGKARESGQCGERERERAVAIPFCGRELLCLHLSCIDKRERDRDGRVLMCCVCKHLNHFDASVSLYVWLSVCVCVCVCV